MQELQQQLETMYEADDFDGEEYRSLENRLMEASNEEERIFTSSNPFGFDEVLSSVQQRVSPAMNAMLTRQVSAAKVKCALFQMPPTKSPGPDGMTALFFQKYWHVVGEDVRSFFHSEKLLRGINHTHIIMVPKVKCPMNMTLLRPISLLKGSWVCSQKLK
ncbi:hypothetical protein Vadar_009244 [Vaccinium darrowii]|uniref:Uncharacterized protein n=1 Tax=Vaccinium darrowii TaxID=229202 RepID=A0ACB7XPE8_9ERIC|nr:hypothetical protein Vadar_009244 [Vaccinium darrowii]